MNIKHNQWKYTETKEIFCLKSSYHLELKSRVSHHYYVIFSRKNIKICQKFSFYIRKVNNYLLWNETFSALCSTTSVQFSLWVMSNFLWPQGLQHARPPCPSPTPGSSLKFTSIESVMPSRHLILCRPLLLLPPVPPSIRVFSNESTVPMRWPKCWSFSFSIILSKEIPGLISFRMDCLDLLAVQGTLKSLFQHHSSKASILRHSAFFTVQISHPSMTTGKTIALTRWTLVGKVMFLLLNMLYITYP